MAAIQAVRTAIFYVLFMGQTIILAVIVGTVAIVARRRTAFSWALAQYWRNSNVAMLRWIVGIKSDVQGGEKIPPGPCIIASKHQSDWDIFALLPFADDQPAFIAKRELIDIPFFGWAARSINTISIDRRLGEKAIPNMLAQAREALDRGCRIVIYPEGTRKAPLAAPDYRQGITRMYAQLNVTVMPVALNSGLFWGRNSPVMWPGTARARFLDPIPPGLSPEEFASRLEAVIEAESMRLIVAAVDAGEGQPPGPALRAKVEAARQHQVDRSMATH